MRYLKAICSNHQGLEGQMTVLEATPPFCFYVANTIYNIYRYIQQIPDMLRTKNIRVLPNKRKNRLTQQTCYYHCIFKSPCSVTVEK